MAHAGHGDTCLFERLHDAKFAIDLVGARKQLSWRLLAQHVALGNARSLGRKFESWIRRTALDLLYDQIVTEVFDLRLEIRFEFFFIEALRRRNFADQFLAHGEEVAAN